MKEPALLHLVLILILTLVTPVYASVELRATVDQNINVVLDIRNINSTVYERIKDENLLNETKIPGIITRNLEKQGLENVYFGLPSEPLGFNHAEKSITARFYLSGSDILNSTFSEETMKRRFHVRTDWRKFELNLTSDFSLDFTEYFGKPLSDWNFSSEIYPTYYYESGETVPFNPLCYFILPREATEVHIADDMETIVFELPPALGESLLNSPFLILGTIVIAIIVSSFYRSVRKRKEQESES